MVTRSELLSDAQLFSQQTQPRLLISPRLVQQRRLFATQLWVDPRKVELSRRFNDGENLPQLLKPTSHLFRLNGILCVLVADGHHRSADALLQGLTIEHEFDTYLGELTDTEVSNPEKGAIKLAKYGVEGIWPFSKYLGIYRKQNGIYTYSR